MRLTNLDSPFLKYVVDNEFVPGDRLPTLNKIGDELGVSVGKLREQLEVGRSLGVVSVKPRLGVQREAFDFSRVVLNGVLFSLATGEASFEQFSQLRQVIELGCWHEAVALLTDEDKINLELLVAKAWDRLRGQPIHIPNAEHRAFHLTIFSRLENPFVQGLLEAYWEAYEASELTRFASYAYWVEVWEYHEKIVERLMVNDYIEGRALLKEHFGLLRPSPTVTSKSNSTSSSSSMNRV